MGVDVKYRLTPNLTLNATLNPDFGQVEVDPAEVNLSAFETQFGERRPFFTEGADIFDFGRGSTGPGSLARNVFYSRRVGRKPQIGAPTSRADLPGQAAILGAAKLSGKTGGWSLGVLDALTREERALWRDDEGAEQSGVAEPLTHYFVGRAVRELRQGQTSFGAIATAVNRRLDDDAAEVLRRSAYVGGVDFSHEWANRAWRLSGYAAGSYVSGTADAIDATQRSSARYLQRPDAEHLSYDPTRTSLSGYAAQVQLTRQSGRHWLGDAGLSVVSAGYEPNDLGFLQRADQRTLNGRISYVENTPGPLFRSYRIEAAANLITNGAGDRVGNNLFVGSRWTLPNYWWYVLNASYAAPITSDRLTRGGPLARYPGDARLYTELGTDQRRRVSAAGGFYARETGAAGGERHMWTRLSLRPSPVWNLSVEPALTRLRAGAQYVAGVDDALAPGTFGRRLVFADMRQTTLSLQTRLNVTFSPDLSLQVFAQPFLTAADFSNYKEFTTPRGFDFSVYGRDAGTIEASDGAYVVDPDGEGPAESFTVGGKFGQKDFNLRSLRGNAVLRWEWRPGSTLFLAWQQNRSDTDEGVGDFRLGRDRAALFRTPPDNVLVFKVSYWLNP